MSYILDALNKSEQERKNRGAPGLGTIHRMPLHSSPNRRYWIAGLAGLAFINALAIAWWFEHRAVPVSQVTATMPAPAKTSTVPTPVPGSTSTEQDILITPGSAVPTDNSEIQPGMDKPVPIAELPVAIQQQIPSMSFSSHIYSNDAKYRMVSINGRILHEGDWVADGIRLVQITEQGVVLTYLDYTFEVSALHDWSYR